MSLPRIAVVLSLLLVAALAWVGFRPARRDLRVQVTEGKVRLQSPAGTVEVPAGAAMRSGRSGFMAEAMAEEGRPGSNPWPEGKAAGAGSKPEPVAPEAQQEEPEWKLRFQEKLRKNVHFSLQGVPFKDAKAYFEKELLHGPILVDRLAMKQEPQLDEMEVRLETPQDGMSLQSALNFLARSVHLDWTLRDEAVLFTTEEGMAEPNVARDYDVRDLLRAITDYDMDGKAVEGNEDEKITGESLVELIKEQTAREVWERQGGNIQPKNGMIFAVAPPATHRQIQEILRHLRDSRVVQVKLQARALAVDLDAWKAIAAEDEAAITLSAAQLKALDQALSSGTASLLEQCQTSAYSNQKIFVGTGLQGLKMNIRPVLSQDGKNLHLEGRYRIGNVDFPSNIQIPDGSTAVFTASATEAGAKDKRILVLLVRADVTGRKTP